MFSLDSTWPFRDKDKPKEGTPERMVCTWADTVLTQAGQKPQRGFGGRIMFYEKDEKNPILVDGQLVVYAFDEAGRDPTDNKPTRRYVFPAEQMPIHMSKSELGASYSFWLPWDEAGGPRTDVSLICRFEPKGGSVVTSEQTKHRLPGSAPALATGGAKKPPAIPEGVPTKPAIETLQSLQAKRTQEHSAQLANYEIAAPADPRAFPINATQDAYSMPTRRMTATTINLPNNFQMPNAAAMMNAAPMPSVAQPAAQIEQPIQNQPLPQQTSAANVSIPATMQAAVAQQLAINRSQPPTPLNSNLSPSASNVQSTIMPGPPSLPQSPSVYGADPASPDADDAGVRAADGHATAVASTAAADATSNAATASGFWAVADAAIGRARSDAGKHRHAQLPGCGAILSLGSPATVISLRTARTPCSSDTS